MYHGLRKASILYFLNCRNTTEVPIKYATNRWHLNDELSKTSAKINYVNCMHVAHTLPNYQNTTKLCLPHFSIDGVHCLLQFGVHNSLHRSYI